MSGTLFLDIDGVLNRSSTWGDPSKLAVVKIDPIDPDMVANLNAAIEKLGGLNIVVSSTWRKTRTAEELDALLRREGVRGFTLLGKTGCHQTGFRGYEIRDWLLDNPEINAGAWCIVDDDSDMLPAQRPRLVKTTFKDGLTSAKAQEIVDIIQRYSPTPPRKE